MPNVGDFRLLKRQIALDLMSKKEEKILRFLIPKYGYLVETVTFEANRRVAGETKYSFSKMVGLGVTSIVSITTRPLYFSVFFAIAFAIISFIDFVYVVFSWFFYQTTPGWASIVGIISIGLTMIFAVLGIFGIYLAQIVRMLTSNDSTKFSITTRDQNHK
jgi:dolichol-phosphate mannosyltransferase